MSELAYYVIDTKLPSKMIFVYILVALVCIVSVNSISIPCEAQLKNLWDENVAISYNWQRPSLKERWVGCQTDRFKDIGTYDFVIVGGGSAGAVLASRLAEVKKWSILLIEAGCDESTFTKIPGGSIYTELSDKSFGYVTTSQKNACLGMKDCQCSYKSAKVIGGETSINNMAYIRANKQDFDVWEGLGISGWSYDDVLAYYKKAEQVKIEGLNCKYHGMDGPWAVSYPSQEPPLTSNILDAAVGIGATLGDYNELIQLRASRMQVNTLDGVRHSVATAYIDGAGPNLHVISHALATHIVFDQKKNVQSLQFLANGTTFSVNIRKELILSGGVINTPQLLMLSGIGPKEELVKFKIPVIADLPVGKYFRDSISLTLTFNTDSCAYEPTSFEQDLLDYCSGVGKLTTPIDHEVLFANVRGKYNDRPDISLTFGVPYTFYSTEIRAKLRNYKREIQSELESIDETSILVTVTLLHTQSEGWIKLKSTDPIDHPRINPKYLDANSDINDLYEGIKFAKRLEDTQAFKDIGAKLVKPNIPQCNRKRTLKDKWICIMKIFAFGEADGIGTSRMGVNPLTSVVDADLVVHGVKNLRVVDGSVIPATLSGNSAATTVMIAEKIADQIKFIYKKACPQ